MEYHTTFLSLPEGRRIIAVSDIHGHLSLLKALLEKIRYKPGDDLLFLVGDTVEKGPDSLGTLRYVMKLCEEGTVYPTMGNVDAFTLSMLDADGDGEAFLRYVNVRRRHSGSSLITEALDELGLPLGGLSDVPAAKQALRAHLARETAFLQSLPALIETEKYIFVHGGLPMADTSALTAADLPGLLKFDAFLEKAPHFDKYVFVGHWPVVLYSDTVSCADPIIDQKRHVVSLDGGCGVKDGAQLNAVLVAPDGSFSHESYDGLPLVQALDAQTDGGDAFHLRWTERFVERLSAENGIARVRVISCGKTLDVPENYLYTEADGRLCCRDFPAHRLKIEPGDALSLIDETPLGLLVKKGSTSGLYGGRVRAL